MSIVREDYRHAFIHVPKAAGTSMESKDFVGGRHHESYRDLHIPDNYFSWGFVRHPCDRLLSFHTSMKYWRPSNYKWMPDSFEEFIIDLPYYIYKKIHTKTQLFFLVNRQGQIGVDFIGRFERLEEDWKTVCQRIGVPHIPLGRENPSQHRPWREVFTRRMEKAVEAHYRVDYETFGYTGEHT